MSQHQVQDYQQFIRDYVRRNFETQGDAATRLGISAAFLSSVIHGKRKPTGRILSLVGLERRVTVEYFRRKK